MLLEKDEVSILICGRCLNIQFLHSIKIEHLKELSPKGLKNAAILRFFSVIFYSLPTPGRHARNGQRNTPSVLMTTYYVISSDCMHRLALHSLYLTFYNYLVLNNPDLAWIIFNSMCWRSRSISWPIRGWDILFSQSTGWFCFVLFELSDGLPNLKVPVYTVLHSVEELMRLAFIWFLG